MGGQIAAAVCGDQCQPGVPVQHPGEDQVGQGDGVLGGLAHRVGQVPAVQALVERAAEGVQEEDRAGLLGPRPEGLVRRVGQFPARGVGGDLHSRQTLFQGVFEGAYGQVRVLERSESEPLQSVGRPGAVRGGRLAREPVQLLGGLLVRPGVVVRGRRTDQLHVHALRVHGGQPYGDIGQPRDALTDHGAADGQRGGAVAPGVQLPGRGESGEAGDEGVDLGEQDVGVHVDGRRRAGGHGSSLSIVIVRPIRPGTSASRTPSSCHCPSSTDASTTARTRGMRRS